MKELLNNVVDLINQLQEKSKTTKIWIDSFKWKRNVRLKYKLRVDNNKLEFQRPDSKVWTVFDTVTTIPSVRNQMPKLLFRSTKSKDTPLDLIGYIKTDEKRSPDRLHKAVVYTEDESTQFKSILKSRFNVEERHLKPINITDYMEDFKYVNSLNGSLYNVMLFKYFEDSVTKNTIFNTCYINIQGNPYRVIFGEESDIDKERKWYTGMIVKAFISEENDIYLYLNMDIIDTEDDECERVVYKVKPFFIQEIICETK